MQSTFTTGFLPSKMDLHLTNYSHSQSGSAVRLLDLHVWGAPVYVLDPRIQDGKKLPCWSPRSQCGQYVGYSSEHASTVPLVLNLTTHHISAQFHVVFDNWFTTVDLDPNEIPEFDSPQWECLFKNKFSYDTDPNDGNLPQFHTEYLEEQDGPLKEQWDHVAQRRWRPWR
jgi:hypothetical protein